MYARTYNNIHNMSKVAKATRVLAALGVLLFSACSSDEVVEEVHRIDTNDSDPLSFSCNVQDDASVMNAPTRGQLLTSGFMVSTYKSFLQPGQQTVMEKYNVEYLTRGNAWDGTVRPYWDYSNVPDQYLRYWDYSAFPYRFHAIAPFPEFPAGFVLNDTHLTIPAPYYYQTCINGLVLTQLPDGTASTTANAEPYLIAQVGRDNDGHDYDYLASGNKYNINTASTTRNREVWLPFHHLNSKIRFGVYSPYPWTTDNRIYIQDLTVKVSTDNFFTSASGYDMTRTDGSNWRHASGFQGQVRQSADVLPTLFTFDGGPDVEGNDLMHRQTRQTAYIFPSDQGIMQLPQHGVGMTVSFKLINRSDGSLFHEYVDVPIKIEAETNVEYPTHDWDPGYLYTYYLVIGSITDKLGITFTATLTDWEDIVGSLTTDLEK